MVRDHRFGRLALGSAAAAISLLRFSTDKPELASVPRPL
jgi:hypothetical protein